MTAEDTNPSGYDLADIGCYIEEFEYLWKNPDQYLLVSVPGFPIPNMAVIYEIESGSDLIIECDNIIFEILDRMRAAGVKEVTEIPQELIDLAEQNRSRWGHKAPRGFEEWLNENRPKKRKKK